MTTSLQAALGAYRNCAAQVHPLVAVVRLFDEVLRRIPRIVAASEARHMEEAYQHLSRASAILRGLASNLRADLNGSEGEEMSRILKQTYVTQLLALHAAFGKKDARQRYERIRSGLVMLRNAWAEAAGMALVSPGPSGGSAR